MITRDALYQVVEDAINAAIPTDPLYDARSWRSLRGDVGAVKKTVRVECFVGQHVITEEDKRKEANVKATIQCTVLPDDTDPASLEVAADVSFDMGRRLFEVLASNTSLGGAVCDSYFDEFETGYTNMGATEYGATYLDGLINNAS